MVSLLSFMGAIMEMRNPVKSIIMQSSAVATGNGTAIVTSGGSDGGFTTLTCQVKGITSATITWEATCDGTNWVAVGFTTMADVATIATTATADGIYRAVVLGFASVRARISTWASGAITVTGIAVA